MQSFSKVSMELRWKRGSCERESEGERGHAAVFFYYSLRPNSKVFF